MNVFSIRRLSAHKREKIGYVLFGLPGRIIYILSSAGITAFIMFLLSRKYDIPAGEFRLTAVVVGLLLVVWFVYSSWRERRWQKKYSASNDDGANE